ncbi:MAG: hypothetical protein AVDCRST_MAG56-4309 [uncultured Cytophagales bacterium]|uniref:Uncharacterized protein n=1 Tax=uncultured Cytophagales bacterium TaxID=158755 RepID=A0A6J4JUI8_9SPHI|nr:MAG: hypothetical protein AVDCRST_MAG56-4309 [uncultured Cytophagales bacterium]
MPADTQPGRAKFMRSAVHNCLTVNNFKLMPRHGYAGGSFSTL